MPSGGGSDTNYSGVNAGTGRGHGNDEIPITARTAVVRNLYHASRCFCPRTSLWHRHFSCWAAVHWREQELGGEFASCSSFTCKRLCGSIFTRRRCEVSGRVSPPSSAFLYLCIHPPSNPFTNPLSRVSAA